MASEQQRSDGFVSLEERLSGYTVYDQNYEKIGKVDDLFVDESDNPEYIGVKMGFLGTRSTLIPFEIVRINDERELVEVAAEKSLVKDGPSFDDDREITPEFEREVHAYYGLEYGDDRGNYGDYYASGEGDGNVDLQPGERQRESSGLDDAAVAGAATGATASGSDADRDVYDQDDDTRATSGSAGPGMTMGDTDSGEFREHDADAEGAGRRDSDLEDEDELRVRRSEEELRAGTREREAGSMRVRKRVRTERERMEVPTRREEVSVERVPVNEEATDAEIGEDEISVPVVEEEVVVEKKPVVKEEIRLRKDVVEETQTVEEEVRKEEVDIEDATERGRGLDDTDEPGRGDRV
ncbi:TIGR02271: conserved domain [Rubrobacter radiotolerans]|uniref:DUF2382 domain-containing protein n=1 Tax=Rubrobacter radiotolerans TaxID=42256 RepID=A0A023X348_RUBRA|nr:DUF2382 domain-containing protein [Rubrobacter radiotolerans]AHY46494.1 TIGR02271: conserved domain [Rubrobacter radiotolerans]MDX5893901.1 DUF2382 domain-containing protein [Rubrobacter radiotolerans]SMC04727.1 conserved domain-containing protein [Rubrobacter radiotolerans DSM 5868]